MPQPTPVVYACRNADNEIIYIGHTSDLDERCRQHRYKSPWWTEVTDVQHFPMPDLATAKEREAAAIAAVRPTYNKQHRDNNAPGLWPDRSSSAGRRARAVQLIYT